MSEAVAHYTPEIIEKLVLQGDISKMQPTEKVQYYNWLCESLGLNPATQPFQIIKFQGKETLYAKKDATEQLRKLNGVSVVEQIIDDKFKDAGLFIIIVKLQDKTGRTDTGTGAVNIKGLSGEALANAIMKAETKAKRRGTLSICGLGMLDESELDGMPPHTTATITQLSEQNTEPAKQEVKAEPKNYTELVNNCKTKADLNTLYKSLSKDEQKNYKNLFTNRKEELIKAESVSLDEVVNGMQVINFAESIKIAEGIIETIADMDERAAGIALVKAKLKQLGIKNYEFETSVI